MRQLRLLQYISSVSGGNSTSTAAAAEQSGWWMDGEGYSSMDPSTLSPSELNSVTAGETATNRWRSIRCNPARDSLCHLQSRVSDVEYISRLFPNYPGQVYLTQKDSTLLPSDVARYFLDSLKLVACLT